MGITYRARLQRQIISRRRTQRHSKRNATEEYRATSRRTCNNTSGEEAFTWTTVGYGDDTRLDEA